MLRSVVDEEQRRATYAAVFAIIAFIDVPITYFATRLMPSGLHPVLSGLAGSMAVSFGICMLGMLTLMTALIKRDYEIELIKDRVTDLKTSLGG